MKSYYYDEEDPLSYTNDHDSGHEVQLDQLQKLGVIYKHLDPQNEELIDEYAKQNGYKNRDEVQFPPENYSGDQQTLKKTLDSFFTEHIHEDVEARYCVEGSGFFDVRDQNDKWIRNQLFPGDLIVLPAGIYHRFTLDSKGIIRTVRLFTDEPKWVALNRPADGNPVRESYLKSISV